MILGVGSDLIDIRRIEQTIQKFGVRFIERTFSPAEVAKIEKKSHPMNGYAMRFAAKEACAKALGTGFRQGVSWTDIQTLNTHIGKPTIFLSGKAKELLEQKVPSGMEAQIDVSLTDEYPMAHAIVIISVIPKAVQP